MQTHAPSTVSTTGGGGAGGGGGGGRAGGGGGWGGCEERGGKSDVATADHAFVPGAKCDDDAWRRDAACLPLPPAAAPSESSDERDGQECIDVDGASGPSSAEPRTASALWAPPSAPPLRGDRGGGCCEAASIAAAAATAAACAASRARALSSALDVPDDDSVLARKPAMAALRGDDGGCGDGGADCRCSPPASAAVAAAASSDESVEAVPAGNAGGGGGGGGACAGAAVGPPQPPHSAGPPPPPPLACCRASAASHPPPTPAAAAPPPAVAAAAGCGRLHSRAPHDRPSVPGTRSSAAHGAGGSARFTATGVPRYVAFTTNPNVPFPKMWGGVGKTSSVILMRHARSAARRDKHAHAAATARAAATQAPAAAAPAVARSRAPSAEPPACAEVGTHAPLASGSAPGGHTAGATSTTKGEPGMVALLATTSCRTKTKKKISENGRKFQRSGKGARTKRKSPTRGVGTAIAHVSGSPSLVRLATGRLTNPEDASSKPDEPWKRSTTEVMGGAPRAARAPWGAHASDTRAVKPGRGGGEPPGATCATAAHGCSSTQGGDVTTAAPPEGDAAADAGGGDDALLPGSGEGGGGGRGMALGGVGSGVYWICSDSATGGTGVQGAHTQSYPTGHVTFADAQLASTAAGDDFTEPAGQSMVAHVRSEAGGTKHEPLGCTHPICCCATYRDAYARGGVKEATPAGAPTEGGTDDSAAATADCVGASTCGMAPSGHSGHSWVDVAKGKEEP